MLRSILLAHALAVNCSVLTQQGDYPICSHEFCLPNDYQKFDLPRGNITENQLLGNNMIATNTICQKKAMAKIFEEPCSN